MKTISFSEACQQKLLPIRSNDDPNTSLEQKELSKAVDEVLRTLTPREDSILRKRFGIGENEMSLNEVANFYGVSKYLIARQQARAFRKLRSAQRACMLRIFLEGSSRVFL